MENVCFSILGMLAYIEETTSFQTLHLKHKVLKNVLILK